MNYARDDLTVAALNAQAQHSFTASGPHAYLVGTVTLPAVRSSVETLDDNRIRLSVELDDAEFDREVDDAFRRIARDIRLPGFRPGRVPRRLLEARLGHQAGREEALRSALANYYARAVVEHEVDVIDSPTIDLTSGTESGPVAFDAVVAVRPAVAVEGYEGLRLEIHNPVADPEDVDAEVQRFRQQFAELEPVARSAIDDDNLRIDISCTHAGEVIEGLTTSDYDYRLGTGAVVPEIDQNLRGSRAGDILEFDAPHPDPDEVDRLRFKVFVKEVLQTKLPELDDDFVAENSEFETLDEFTNAISEGQSRAALMRALTSRQEALVEAVGSLVTDDVPESMIDSEADVRITNFTADLERRGHDLDEYLESMQQTHEDFVADARAVAVRSVKVDLALRAVAAAEGLEVGDEAIAEHLRSAVVNEKESLSDDEVAVEVSRLLGNLSAAGRLPALRAELSKNAAMEWIAKHAELVDAAGETIDPEQLRLAEELGAAA